MSQSNLTHSVLNVALVLIEAALTLALRFDANLRRATYPLAKKNTLIVLRTYLPHTQIYVTFSTKGILLDTAVADPTHEPDITINTYSHQLIQAIIKNDMRSVQKISMRGDADTINETRHFLVQLGFASLFQGIIKTFKKDKKSDSTKPEKSTLSSHELKAQIEAHEQQIGALSIRNRELEVSLKEAQSKQKITTIALLVTSITAIISIIIAFIA